LFLLTAVLLILWVGKAVVLYRPPILNGPPFNVWQGPSDEVKALCHDLERDGLQYGRILVDDARVGAFLPWLCGVEVIGGPFFFIWTDYGYSNATMWTFLDTPYSAYDFESWRQALADYDVEWLIVNNDWGVAEWFTLSDWLAVYPEGVEAGPTYGRYQLYKVRDYEPVKGLIVTADHGRIQIEDATPGLRTRLPYHWIPGLEVWPPDGAEVQREMVGKDPIPFIVVVPKEEAFLICDPRGCPER
jgi:hypothetical protein